MGVQVFHQLDRRLAKYIADVIALEVVEVLLEIEVVIVRLFLRVLLIELLEVALVQRIGFFELGFVSVVEGIGIVVFEGRVVTKVDAGLVCARAFTGREDVVHGLAIQVDLFQCQSELRSRQVALLPEVVGPIQDVLLCFLD